MVSKDIAADSQRKQTGLRNRGELPFAQSTAHESFRQTNCLGEQNLTLCPARVDRILEIASLPLICPWTQ